ncbi:copper amine oxidase N-terminal domain-containing protein [Brevibacillus agri]|uniref:copper amine oxidase N-terminal domain-containing protein n=1 Tax=Brevibacillus agri TaxID=51101 RepID=UPI000A8A7B58|nr:copper amine oxidase N-terminal domain-containing protein [Brevibacillus agri]
MDILLKKLASFVLAIALVPMATFSAAAAPAPAQTAVKVEYNKKAIVFPDQKPLIGDSRTLVPIRPIAETLGFKVDWNEKTRTVTIDKGNDNVRLVVTQKIAKKNGQTINLDVPAQIVNQRTVVPVRFIAEALSYKVDWDPATQTVLIADQAVANPNGTEEKPQEQTKPTEEGKKQDTVSLIDKESVVGQFFTFSPMGIYKVAGKVDPKATVIVDLEETSYSVDVKSDGTFEFYQTTHDGIRNFTVKAELDGKQDTFEGELQSAN